jgi:anaerobic magnesium-protoporphyrin IX monomethyl ester cyclase
MAMNNFRNNEDNKKKKSSVLLLYPPFCTPVTPPFSITNLHNFLNNNLTNDNYKLDVLDLNLEFHNFIFVNYKKYYQKLDKNNFDFEHYEKTSNMFREESSKVFSENNKKIRLGEKPDIFDEMINLILDKKPDLVAISIVYSSQSFYSYAIINELKKHNIKVVIGGPAVNSKLESICNSKLNNEIELLNYITNEFENKIVNPDKLVINNFLDFSIYSLDDYFISKPVIPIKTCSVCFYRKCSFCTHYNKKSFYFEYSLDDIKKTIQSCVKLGVKHFFFIDDMIHTKRLIEIATILKPLNINWTCQLRPTNDFDYDVLKTLYDSGLSMIMWGVESGNNRILDLIDKGTNVLDIENVLKNSHNIGIKNILYVIFGFPTETESEFLDTITFFEKNNNYIDLISTSNFGLQIGSKIYSNPNDYGIIKINEIKRTILEPKVEFETNSGLSTNQLSKLRKKYANKILKINKFPNSMNFLREHMFTLIK